MTTYFSTPYKKLQYKALLFDGAFVTFLLAASSTLTNKTIIEHAHIGMPALVLGVFIVSIYFSGLYELPMKQTWRATIRLTPPIFLASLLSFVCFKFEHALFFAATLSLMWPLLRVRIIRFFVGRIRSEHVLLVGCEETVWHYKEMIESCPLGTYTVVKVVTREEMENSVLRSVAAPSGQNVLILVDFERIAFSDKGMRQIVDQLVKTHRVADLPTLASCIIGRIPINLIRPNWILSHFAEAHSDVYRGYNLIKRAMDLLVSLVALVILMPLMVVLAIAIKIDTSGPVLFIQERLGRGKVAFPCLKFRSMIVGAELHTGPVWSHKNDPRITRVGRFMRRTRLDELPQLINVLKGDMSLVGPRPIRKYFRAVLVERTPLYDMRFSVLPGLTGWAQIMEFCPSSEEAQYEKFTHDMFYMKNKSIVMDAYIAIKTARTLFLGGTNKASRRIHRTILR